MEHERSNKDSGLERELEREPDVGASATARQPIDNVEINTPKTEHSMRPSSEPTSSVSTDGKTISLDMSPELSKVLTSLARIANTDERDVLRRAIVLMGVAVEARQEGMKFGIAKRDQELITEIVGL